MSEILGELPTTYQSPTMALIVKIVKNMM